MLITISSDATNASTEFGQLDRIFYRIEDRAHDWKIDNEDALLKSEWLKNRPDSVEFVKKMVQDASYPKQPRFTRQLHVCMQPKSDAAPTELAPQQAAHFVQEPLYVLMENKFTDSILLNTAIKFLAPEELTDPCLKPEYKAISHIGAGGIGEIPKHIQDHRERAKELNIPLRMVVFTDSDGLRPGELHENAQRVKKACSEQNIPCCILSKRTIENYIPDEVFDAWVSKPGNISSKQKIDVLKEMTPEQRDHFYLKDGFSKQHDTTLYASLAEEQRKQWAQGLGNEVIKLLKEYQTNLTAALRARDHQGDLDKLIAMLAAEL